MLRAYSKFSSRNKSATRPPPSPSPGVEKHVFERRGSGTQGHLLVCRELRPLRLSVRERCQCSVRYCRIPTIVARTQSIADSSSVHTLSACDIIDPMALMRVDPLTAVSTLKTDTRFRKCVCAMQNNVITTLLEMVRSAVAEWLCVAERRYDRSWWWHVGRKPPEHSLQPGETCSSIG